MKSRSSKRWNRLAGTSAYFQRKTVKAEDSIKEQLIKELRQRISELKKSENQCERGIEKLLVSENKYRVLIENFPQKIFCKDKNLVNVFCNMSYAYALRIKSDEIAGKTNYDFYTKKLAVEYRADDNRLWDQG